MAMRPNRPQASAINKVCPGQAPWLKAPDTSFLLSRSRCACIAIPLPPTPNLARLLLPPFLGLCCQFPWMNELRRYYVRVFKFIDIVLSAYAILESNWGGNWLKRSGDDSRTAGAIPTAHGRADRPSSLDNLAVTPTTGPVTGRMTAETREALPKALQKIFQNHKVCRKVVIDLLRGKGPNATLKKAEILRAASKVLGRSIANNEYTKVINDLSESRGSLWYLKESR
ncbi:hypothetical protein MLD38_028644 [Melastoma candidum]|uniref:Uncharacterized protein n=1 Tax=Melastoma candidum TaxID=119954 RepID=A0ACB9N3E6_9MYRT|nr:hypothetical protein MLD38_028644 [Melastoma candidum]